MCIYINGPKLKGFGPFVCDIKIRTHALSWCRRFYKGSDCTNTLLPMKYIDASFNGTDDYLVELTSSYPHLANVFDVVQ